MPLSEMEAYRPPQTAEADLDRFWEETLAQAATVPFNVETRPLEYPADKAGIYELSYDGWGGARIKSLFILPAGGGPFPVLVYYNPYNYLLGYPYQFLHWTLQGYAVLAVSVRGQLGGSTDVSTYEGGHTRGWMTAGILDPYSYYYRGVYVDCVRALDILAERPEVDAERMAVVGLSQGGGLSLAVAALSARPCLCMAEIPYLCHIRRGVDLAERPPYLEIREYVRFYPDRLEQCFRTLSYFDNLNLCTRITCPTLMNVGLLDDICPPSTGFAVYNHLTCVKEMVVYPYHNHEFIPPQVEKQMVWAKRYLARQN